jgi:hypothetical protein
MQSDTRDVAGRKPDQIVGRRLRDLCPRVNAKGRLAAVHAVFQRLSPISVESA